VNELGAELDRYRRVLVTNREHAAANAFTRLQNDDVDASFMQGVRRSEAGRTRADHDRIDSGVTAWHYATLENERRATMAVTVKRVTLWRREVENRPGMMAETLEPLASAGVDLQVVMGYRFPGHEERAAIEVYPVTGKKATTAAQAGGLSPASIPSLIVEGDSRPGLAHDVARSLADASINVSFEVGQVLGRRFSAVFGFESDADAARASALIKKAAAERKATRRKASR
jgi:hypothetical protein